MDVTIFKARGPSVRGETVYLVVPTGKDAGTVPAGIREQLGELVEFKTIEMEPGDKRIGANVEDVLRQIDEQGYAVQRTRVDMQEYVMGEV